MAILQEYHRPNTLQEALALLQEPGRRRVPLAGGTDLVGRLETRAIRDVDGVVDLRALGLNYVQADESVLRLGAMATLSDVCEHPVAGSLAHGLLRRAARGEGPINLRNAATVGGVVAVAAYDSEFYAGLLALGATVVLHEADGVVEIPLEQLTQIHGLITEVRIPLPGPPRGGLARVARTPSDRPIVAAVAVVDDEGRSRVALCGVAARPVLQGSPLDPPDNFKGSADYRRAMVPVLTRRALAEAQGGLGIG